MRIRMDGQGRERDGSLSVDLWVRECLVHGSLTSVAIALHPGLSARRRHLQRCLSTVRLVPARPVRKEVVQLRY
jgi:hypothetical protein